MAVAIKGTVYPPQDAFSPEHDLARSLTSKVALAIKGTIASSRCVLCKKACPSAEKNVAVRSDTSNVSDGPKVALAIKGTIASSKRVFCKKACLSPEQNVAARSQTHNVSGGPKVALH